MVPHDPTANIPPTVKNDNMDNLMARTNYVMMEPEDNRSRIKIV